MTAAIQAATFERTSRLGAAVKTPMTPGACVCATARWTSCSVVVLSGTQREPFHCAIRFGGSAVYTASTSIGRLNAVKGVDTAGPTGVAVIAHSVPSGISRAGLSGPGASARKSTCVAVDTPPAGMTSVNRPSLDATLPPAGPTRCSEGGGAEGRGTLDGFGVTDRPGVGDVPRGGADVVVRDGVGRWLGWPGRLDRLGEGVYDP